MASTIVSELSLAMLASTPFLPLELWHIIFADVVADSMDPGKRWVVKQSISGQWHSKRLRGLSQVNHALRRVLMPFMWKFVFLHAERRDMEDLIGLSQLSHDLSIRGPLLSAADCIQQLQLQVDCDNLRFPTSSEKYAKPDGYSWSREAFKKLMRCRMGDGPQDEGALPLTLRKLSHALIGCKQLTTLEWRGWLEPDPYMLVNLSQCTSLRDLYIDLGTPEYGDMLQDDWELPASLREMDGDGVLEMDRDASVGVATTAALMHAIRRVYFAVETRLEGCQSCGFTSLALESDMNPARGSTAVQMLTACRFMDTFTLGAPKLLYERWMVPLWAQLERLELDPDYRELDIIGTDGGMAPDNLRDPEMDEKMLRTAQVFPYVLDSDERIAQLLREQPDDVVDALARAVHSAINGAAQLSEWHFWFQEWTDVPWDEYGVDEHASTIAVMRNIAEVLVERYSRTTDVRQKYTTPKPSGYLCQTEEWTMTRY